MQANASNLLTIADLTINLQGKYSHSTPLHNFSLQLQRGQTVGIIGASGSGKTLSMLALLGLLPPNTHTQGSILFDGQELLHADETTLCAVRGKHIGMVFQEPMTALNPLQRVGDAIAEPLRLHHHLSKSEATEQAIYWLERVGIAHASTRWRDYPHQFSGGQRQRIAIASAIACRPSLLIADEPTTALDSTVQAQVLQLIQQLIAEENMALALISHDLALVARHVQYMYVLQNGKLVEHGNSSTIFKQPKHPYTRSLLDACLDCHTSTHTSAHTNKAAETTPMLQLRDVHFYYRHTHALKGVGFDVATGSSLGIVGASGSGKSTLARLIMAFAKPHSGSIQFAGQDIHQLSAAQRQQVRPNIQMVFQDPYASLNPRLRILNSVIEPLYHTDLSLEAKQQRAVEVMQAVGLSADDLHAYPHQFSGGQRQRIAIARALISRPQLIVADEPASALDAAVQAQVLALLRSLQQQGIAIILISHNLAVVQYLCEHIAVMHSGEIVEYGNTQTVLQQPQHACTQGLIDTAIS